MIQALDDSQSKRSSAQAEGTQAAGGAVPRTDHGAARREAGADRIVGGCGSQYPFDRADVGVQPRIVSKWRRRFAERGLAGLQDEPRATKKPIYGQATNQRILALLDKPPPAGYGRGQGLG
jgi:hypothetical protein